MARPKPYFNSSGQRVPSVTTITSRFKDSGGLMYWSNLVGRGERDCEEQDICIACGTRPGKTLAEARDKAADLGTYAHALIDGFITGHVVEPEEFAHLTAEQHELADQCFRTFEQWWAQNDCEAVETELALVSEAHNFGGRLDGLIRVCGELSVVDWKTSAGLYADHIAQVCGGYMILAEESGFEPLRADLLRVSKETAGFSHHMWPRSSVQPAIDWFLQARELYELQRSLAKLLK